MEHILNARSNDILNYINGGGGLVAGSPSRGAISRPTISSDFFRLQNKTRRRHRKDQSEVGNTVTPFGTSLGLTVNDIRFTAPMATPSHNIFTADDRRHDGRQRR